MWFPRSTGCLAPRARHPNCAPAHPPANSITVPLPPPLRTQPRAPLAGFFGELAFPGPNGKQWTFTTQVSIIPTTFPYADCTGVDCQGSLV